MLATSNYIRELTCLIAETKEIPVLITRSNKLVTLSQVTWVGSAVKTDISLTTHWWSDDLVHWRTFNEFTCFFVSVNLNDSLSAHINSIPRMSHISDNWANFWLFFGLFGLFGLLGLLGLLSLFCTCCGSTVFLLCGSCWTFICWSICRNFNSWFNINQEINVNVNFIAAFTTASATVATVLKLNCVCNGSKSKDSKNNLLHSFYVYQSEYSLFYKPLKLNFNDASLK